MEGTLYKKAGSKHILGWQPKVCATQGHFLMYCKPRHKRDVFGENHEKLMTLEEEEEDVGSKSMCSMIDFTASTTQIDLVGCEFHVKTEGRVYRFRASTSEVAKRWCCLMNGRRKRERRGGRGDDGEEKVNHKKEGEEEDRDDGGMTDFVISEAFAEPLSPVQSGIREQLYNRVWGSHVPRHEKELADSLCIAGHRRATLSRFLIARDFDIEKAFALMLDAMHWRKESGINDLMSKTIGGEPPGAWRQKVAAWNRSIEYGLHGFDREGRLVYFERAGQFDLHYSLKNIVLPDGKTPDLDWVLNWHVQWLEFEHKVAMDRISRATKRLIDKVVVIQDLEGFSLKIFTPAVVNHVRAMTKNDQNCYPELLHKMYIVNAPSIFAWAWRVIRKFLAPRVRGKIEIFGPVGPAEIAILHRAIDPRFLPRHLGGDAPPGEDGGGPSQWTTSHLGGTPPYMEYMLRYIAGEIPRDSPLPPPLDGDWR